MPIPFDYHTHNFRCGHASGSVEEYVQAATANGLAEFGASDHAPAYFLEGDKPLPGTVMAKSELGEYAADVLRLREKYSRQIVVKLGIESDFVPGSEAAYREALASHPFDYVIGSVHWVHDLNIMVPRTWDTVENPGVIYGAYYDLIIQSARSGMYDILAHITAAECYGPTIAPDLADFWYSRVADAVAESGCVVEINTSGFRKMRTPENLPGSTPFPNRLMLRELAKRGVPLTFGSDAHRPADVAFEQPAVTALLQEMGVSDTPETYTVHRTPLLTFRSRPLR